MKSALQFQRPDGRADFEKARNAVRALLADASSDDTFKAFQQLANDFDAGVFRVKPDLLGSVLCWKPEDRELSAWIYDQHCEMAELARRAADIFERRVGCDDARTMRLVGAAFMHWGEAAKWVVGRRDRYDYSWMHWLMRMAVESSRHLERCEVRLDARTRTVTVESLFLRTLLLDRFAGGNLTRQQIEVLDAWLWEWAPDLKGTTIWPGQPVLRADLDAKGGLRHGRREDHGPALYLAIAPLEARRQAVIKEFHRGRIVPSLGVASDFRVEEHVAVLEQLRIVFEMPQEESGQRVNRRPAGGQSIEVWLGISEILSRGMKAPDLGAEANLSIKGAAISDTQRVRRVQFLDENEAQRRFLRLTDVSETGYGFEANEKEATAIAVGDVIGMRISDEDPCVIGRVVRRVPGQIEGKVVIGVRTITDAAQALTLSRTQRQNRPDDDEVFIYVPGGEDSGAQDTFLVPEKVLLDQASRATVIGDDQFTIEFNRVRRKGRGWAMAGFEILDARRYVPPAAPVPEAKPVGTITGRYTILDGAVPRFELVEKDDYSDAFDRELGSRLLN